MRRVRNYLLLSVCCGSILALGAIGIALSEPSAVTPTPPTLASTSSTLTPTDVELNNVAIQSLAVTGIDPTTLAGVVAYSFALVDPSTATHRNIDFATLATHVERECGVDPTTLAAIHGV